MQYGCHWAAGNDRHIEGSMNGAPGAVQYRPDVTANHLLTAILSTVAIRQLKPFL